MVKGKFNSSNIKDITTLMKFYGFSLLSLEALLAIIAGVIAYKESFTNFTQEFYFIVIAMLILFGIVIIVVTLLAFFKPQNLYGVVEEIEEIKKIHLAQSKLLTTQEALLLSFQKDITTIKRLLTDYPIIDSGIHNASQAISTGDNEKMFMFSLLFRYRNQADEAIQILNHLIQKDPNNPRYHSNLAYSLEAKGEYSSAISELLQADQLRGSGWARYNFHLARLFILYKSPKNYLDRANHHLSIAIKTKEYHLAALITPGLKDLL